MKMLIAAESIKSDGWDLFLEQISSGEFLVYAQPNYTKIRARVRKFDSIGEAETYYKNELSYYNRKPCPALFAGENGGGMAYKLTGALRAAEIILNGKREISTEYGKKTALGIADLIDNETGARNLLEACKAMLAREAELTTGDCYTEYRAIEAAILKAEGGKS
jgi:hypothetical protein